MRNLIVAALTGLILGTLGALGYSHYFGEGQKLAELQAELNAASKTGGKPADHGQDLKSETDALSAQIDQLTASNDDLKRQLAEAKQGGIAMPGGRVIPAAMIAPMVSGIKARMSRQQQQRMLLLKTRLHLTPEQEAALQAEFDKETAKIDEMAAKATQDGKVDPGALAGFRQGQGAMDSTLDSILTPDQKTAYQQMQTEQKTARTETAATAEMNEVAPLLQLSDTQRDQVYTALYQARVNAQDPAWIQSHTDPSNPTSNNDLQTQAKMAALEKVLTPDQMVIYKQAAQNQGGGGGGGGRFGGFGGGFGGGGPPGGP